MANIKRLLEEKNIRRIFEIGLIFKGVFAIMEIVGGIVLLFITQAWLVNYIQYWTQDELIENPDDFVANHLWSWAQNFSGSAKYFAIIYLVSHGIIKLWLIFGLLRNTLWYYPAAIVIFGLFIVYQVYRFTFTHSILLMFITLVDLVVIGLTYHEYRYLRHNR